MKYFVFFLFIIVFSSCEKAINLQPESQMPLLVVDGNIENGKPPYIFLSTSLDYFSSINPALLLQSIVTTATVTLSDGTKTDTLQKLTQPLIPGVDITYYGSDTSNPANAVLGAEGKTYTLTVYYNNNIYTAITTIPVVAKKIDSLWWKPAPFIKDDTTKVVGMARLTDPKGYGNYIRYFTKVNSESFLPGAFSVFDDQVIDGTTYIAQVDKGIDRNQEIEREDYGYFKRGDTVTVKFANIDKATYNFWRTLEFSYQSVGNPFSSPVKVLSNVSNGALGVFCGYGVQYKSLIIPK